MNVVGLPSFPCLCVNIICVFFVLLNSKSIVAGDDQLSVTSYGSFEIAMLRHGEKYAANRPCYKWEDVSPLYYGLTHVRGLMINMERYISKSASQLSFTSPSIRAIPTFMEPNMKTRGIYLC
ncbi:unnamed protein product [Porites evermanni]|uniref:Lysosomal acid phosphatase n=1 Tax=Porites evermanni TaxID=104178 RepID=A0ABN8SA10_9CNID|nr:unnamed protein product [Porites evermanni]